MNSLADFRHTNLDLTEEFNALVPAAARAEYTRLPDRVHVRDREVDVQYDVEERADGLTAVARLRLPEKLARTLTESEIPELDRPLRFVVTRGARGAARAATLAALQEELERPFTDEELEGMNRAWEARREERRERKRRMREGRSNGGEERPRRRRKQRPGRRERAGQRGESPPPNERPGDGEKRRGPRPPYTESESGDQRQPRQGGLRRRRGPRWR